MRLLPCEQLFSLTCTPTLSFKQETNHCLIEITHSGLGHGHHFDLRVITQWAHVNAAVMFVGACIHAIVPKLVFMIQG